MGPRIKNFSISDPRDFDGDPFEVAERAARQSLALVDLLTDSLASADVMARNAEMERQLLRAEDADAPGWEGTPQGRQFKAAEQDVKNLRTRLGVLARAAGFNPRKPPKV
jgi:hypothetical protein